MLNLHAPTLLLAATVGCALLVLELEQSLIRRAGTQRPELRLWARGCWAALLGGLALFGRPWLPSDWAILVGNQAICLALALFGSAIHTFVLRAPAPPALRLSGWAALPWVLWSLEWSVAARTELMSWLFAVLLAPSVWLLARHGWQAERSLRTVTMVLTITMVGSMARGVHVALEPAFYESIMAPEMGHGLSALVGFFALLGSGWAFVMASFERTLQELEDLATHDGLTGCINRHTADTLLDHALQRGVREGAPVAFVLLDLDHFKRINDAHGHRMGDEVLRRFAEAVRGRLRASDIFCRVGGEEFGLILPATDGPGARKLSEAVLSAVADIQVVGADGMPVQVSVSAGVAVALSDSGWAADQLYARADAALYAAKHAGRARVMLENESSSP